MGSRQRSKIPWMALLAIGVWLTGCATTSRVDWNARVGVYTYDQAVIDLGPPDKMATLSDGTVVAEWMTSRGRYYGSSAAYGYYGAPYGRYGVSPGFVMAPQYLDQGPDKFLRLVFDSGKVLVSWKGFMK